jgi:hypothetical protein
MPKYNINIRTESHIADTVAVERDSHTGLRLELAKFVGELLKDHAELIWETRIGRSTSLMTLDSSCTSCTSAL